MSSLWDTLPIELVERIMDTKKDIELQDELNQLQSCVTHKDLPLLNEYSFIDYIDRLHIDSEYLNVFREENFLSIYKAAIEKVITSINSWVRFETIENSNQMDHLKILVDQRLQELCFIIKQKFGTTNVIETEIIARRMVNKQIGSFLYFRLHSLWIKYKTIFKRKEFKLRYYNTNY